MLCMHPSTYKGWCGGSKHMHTIWMLLWVSEAHVRSYIFIDIFGLLRVCVCVGVFFNRAVHPQNTRLFVLPMCPLAAKEFFTHTHTYWVYGFFFLLVVCAVNANPCASYTHTFACERKAFWNIHTHIILSMASFFFFFFVTCSSFIFRVPHTALVWCRLHISFFFHLVLFKRESVLKCTLNTLLAHFRIKCGRDELYRPHTHIYSLSLSVSVGRSAVVYIKLLSRTIRKNVPCTFIFKNVKCVQCQSSFILFSLIYGFLNV